MKYIAGDDSEIFNKLLKILIPEDENPYFKYTRYENEYAIIHQSGLDHYRWFDVITFKSEELHDIFLLKHFNQ